MNPPPSSTGANDVPDFPSDAAADAADAAFRFSSASAPSPASSPAPAPDPLVERIPWLLVLMTLAAVTLAYPVRLQDAWLAPLIRSWKENAATSPYAYWMLNQFEAYLSFYLSPLTLKGVLAAVGALLAMTVWLSGRVLAPIVGDDYAAGPTPIRATNSDVPAAAPSSISARARALLAWPFWTLFLLWSAASALWSPTAAVSAQAVLWLAVFGGFGSWLLRRGISAREARQLAVALILLGAVIGAISLLQATRAFGGVIFKFMIPFDDPRNAFGSLMGHNTAVASFLMMTGFPALALLFEPGGRTRRALLAGYIVIALLAMLLVQSRAIWILGPVLAGCFLAALARARGLRPPWRFAFYLAAVLGFGLASQTVRAPWNPFFLEKSPLLQRFRDLSPLTILEGTRARMVIASGSLIAEKPVLGHGLYSFAYVFPKAQADYFARHPDTRLRPTEKRSHMAHNEYVQTLVESGAIGLLLGLGMLAELAWRGRRSLAGMAQGERALRMAFGFSALGMCLHAVADFPFHIPQLVIPWMICAAAFASPRRGDPAPALTSGAAASDAGASPAPGAVVGPRTLRPDRVARLTIGLILPALTPFLAYPFFMIYQADIDAMYGQAYWQLLVQQRDKMSPQDYDKYSQYSLNAFKRSLVLDPTNDPARLIMGQLYGQRALAYIQQENRQPAGAPKFYTRAAQLLDEGRRMVNESMTSLRYHGTFWALAGIDQAEAMITPPERRAPIMASYKRNLELSIYYSPAALDAPRALDQLLSNAPEQNAERLVALRRGIRKISPPVFHDWYYVPASRALQNRDYETAVAAARELLKVDADDPFLLLFALDAFMRGGFREDAMAVLDHLETLPVDREKFPIHPYNFSLGRLYRPMMAGRWEELLAALDSVSPEIPTTRAILRGYETYARGKVGGVDRMPSRYIAPQGMTAEEWDRMAAEGLAFTEYRLIRDLPAARASFEARAAMPGPAPAAEFWLEFAYLALEQGDKPAYAAALAQAEKSNPRHPTLPKVKALAAKKGW